MFSEQEIGHWDTEVGKATAEHYVTLERSDLVAGAMTDMELANRIYMAGRKDNDLIVWQTAAKERIRWLSAKLAEANASVLREAEREREEVMREERSMNCPRCGVDCCRDEVHNGLAVLYGPWGCACGWSEDSRYDQSEVRQPPNGRIDQWGGFTPSIEHDGFGGSGQAG